MATVFSTTRPGTQFDLKVESIETPAGVSFFDVTAIAVSSGVASWPKR